ncbi:MAG: hypothetical protein Q8S13_09970, partial [Dehalococcoidia bacterium]|nr:hypothetical protein [Dehalococcoidia bacterium]
MSKRLPHRVALQRSSATSPPISESLLKTLTEGSMYIYALSATIDGALSFEARICACHEALETYHAAQRASGEYGESPRVLGTGDDVVVYEFKHKLFRIGYALDGTRAMLVGEPVEVTAEFS